LRAQQIEQYRATVIAVDRAVSQGNRKRAWR
jgi:hypothetical protein